MLEGFTGATCEDVLAYLTFPLQHRAKLHSTNEMDKTRRAFHGSFLVALTTSWPSAERRLQAPPSRLIRPLPV
ncbi:hypothetical protein DK389_15975 [Methylobacterium durans]|uniref:Uncharacterized protein n=1 Tax=Methylobacterium durans TaxID=2202825 RepID=A0A2U8W6M5_9HYPH|nr:hypothetical protein DK389_15975 [Methylobacterium durans]